MSNISETDFFHTVAPLVIRLVQDYEKEMAVVESKGLAGDYSTQLDIDTEELVVSEIKKYFLDDAVLAEEGYSETSIPEARIWLIDPICGTNNLGKGINNYCTNIALAEKGKVIASCVIDHSQQEYIWSVGNGKVFVNSSLFVPPAPELGQKIDIDFGSVRKAGPGFAEKHNACLLRLIKETDFDLVSLNASLGQAYTAIGKMDGFIVVYNHPWDIAAASFLIQQAGGTISGIDGAPWTLSTIGAIGGRTPEIHATLLDLFLNE